jgi:putative mRNA 3-end processing factor
MAFVLMDFTIDCLGASREVGRSAFLVRTDRNIMLDYGIKIFDDSGKVKYPLESPQEPDFAVISHAHLDHSGSLPTLYNKSRIRWYATPPTCDICEILWKDNMKIMGETLEYGLPEYNRALKYWSPLLYDQAMQTGDTRITLRDAGHIAGAAMVEMEYNERTLLYSGDFKCEDTRMHKKAKFVDDVDILMMESTYAFREHPPRKETEAKLMEEIYDTLENGGNALLPSFALGRTQELISIIRSNDEDIPVFVDGMGKDISSIYLKHPRYIRDAKEFRDEVRSVTMVQGMEDKKRAVKEPSVIISTSGMMNGGPVLGYLFNTNKDSKLIFTGYCVEGTNGWSLQNKGFITKDEQELTVDLPVTYLDLSAHAGRTELLEFIRRANPEKVVLIHGDRPDEFAKELKETHGYDAVAPLAGERLEL